MSGLLSVPSTESARAERLATWEQRATPWIIVSALLPIVSALGENAESPIRNVIGVACWLVFLVDLLVHVRLAPGYLRTGRGRFDLVIVVITAPWYLFFGGGSQFVLLARLARLARVFMAGSRSKKARHLLQQLGSVAIYAGGLLVACALIEKWVEPASSGFVTYGDAFWWGFVTITTVGYGDLYPVTTAGRIAGVVLMLGGVAFLGTLAGTLSAFFGVGDPVATAANAESSAAAGDTDTLAAEIAALREQISALVARLDATP